MRIIQNKINSFISKLYFYKALEGLTVFVLFFTAYFLIYILAESVFYLDSFTRTFLFYFSAVVSLLWIAYKVLYPGFQSLIPSLQISKDEASKIIGDSNPEIDDRLLNLLQLEKLGDDDLVLESIKVLEKDLFRFDFLKAINLKNLLLFVKLISIPFIFFAIISLINFDGIIASPTNRILAFKKDFEKPLGFRVNIISDSLRVVEGESFTLKFVSDADKSLLLFVGADVFELNDFNNVYKHVFKKNNKSFSFRIGEELEKSYNFRLEVIKRPKIKSISLHSIAPKYTKIEDKTFSNLANIEVPYGSVLQWNIEVFSDEEIKLKLDSTLFEFQNNANLKFFDMSVYRSTDYSILVSNELLKNYIKLNYHLEVVKDERPTIEVRKLRDDKFKVGVYNFYLRAKDDYGITRVGYKIFDEKKLIDSKSFRVRDSKYSEKTLELNTNKLNLSTEAYVKFYVIDNDGINGHKLTFSAPYSIYIFSDADVSVQNSLLKDSLTSAYSDKLNDKISAEKFKKDYDKIDAKNTDEKEKLGELQDKLEKSISEKMELKKNLNSINDKELLAEIEKAISAQQELLKEISEAMKNLEGGEKQSEKLEAKNQFQENKTLNFLRKIAANEMLKKMSSTADDLKKQLDKSKANNDKLDNDKLQSSLDKLEDQLENYSKLKGDNSLKEEVKKDIDNISEESSKGEESDTSSMEESAENISSKIKSKIPMSMSGGGSASPDIKELEYLLSQYLSLSFSEESLIVDYDFTDVNDQFTQYNILKTLSVVNTRLYNFALSNEMVSRQSFDLIYPLQTYLEKISESYESNSPQRLNQRQRELLTDVNGVVDFLSDLLGALQNADASASAKGDGNDRKQGTPQDLVDEQQKLNSQSKKGEGQEFSDDEISDIIKKQESIRNKFNEMSGANKSEFNKEVDNLKKALLKQKSNSEIVRSQDRISKLLKDYRGEAKEEDKKRKSSSHKGVNYDVINEKLIDDSIGSESEKLDREKLDYKEFYKNIILENK